MAFTTGQWLNIYTGDVCDKDNAPAIMEANDVQLKKDKPESVVASSNRASAGLNLHEGGSLGIYSYKSITTTAQALEGKGVGSGSYNENISLHNRMAVVCAIVRCDNTEAGASAGDYLPGGAADTDIFQTLIFDMDNKTGTGGANRTALALVLGVFFAAEGSVQGSAGVPNNQQYIAGTKIKPNDVTIASTDSIELYVDAAGKLQILHNSEGDTKGKDWCSYIQFSPLMR